jgi:hypothetical protein
MSTLLHIVALSLTLITADTAKPIDSSYEHIMQWNDTARGGEYDRQVERDRYRYRNLMLPNDNLQPTYAPSPFRRKEGVA